MLFKFDNRDRFQLDIKTGILTRGLFQSTTSTDLFNDRHEELHSLNWLCFLRNYFSPALSKRSSYVLVVRVSAFYKGKVIYHTIVHSEL